MGAEGEEEGASWSFDLLAGKSLKEGVRSWPRPGWGGGQAASTLRPGVCRSQWAAGRAGLGGGHFEEPKAGG